MFELLKDFYIYKFLKFAFYASNALTIVNFGKAIYNLKKKNYKINRGDKFHFYACSIIAVLFYEIKTLIPIFNIYSTTYEYFHNSVENVIIKTFTSYNAIYRTVIPTIEKDKEAIDNAIKDAKDATSEMEKINDVLNSPEEIEAAVYFSEEELSKLTPEQLKKKIEKELGVDRVEFYDENEFIDSIDEYLEKNGYKKRKKSIKEIVTRIKKRVRRKDK